MYVKIYYGDKGTTTWAGYLSAEDALPGSFLTWASEPAGYEKMSIELVRTLLEVASGLGDIPYYIFCIDTKEHYCAVGVEVPSDDSSEKEVFGIVGMLDVNGGTDPKKIEEFILECILNSGGISTFREKRSGYVSEAEELTRKIDYLTSIIKRLEAEPETD